MLDHNGEPKTEWWNSDRGKAAYIDFTKLEAANWFSSRLTKLLDDTGVDSYKFDAGESSWSPPVGISLTPRMMVYPVPYILCLTGS